MSRLSRGISARQAVAFHRHANLAAMAHDAAGSLRPPQASVTRCSHTTILDKAFEIMIDGSRHIPDIAK